MFYTSVSQTQLQKQNSTNCIKQKSETRVPLWMTNAFLGSLTKSTINSKLASEYCVFIISNIPMTCYMSAGHVTIHIPTTAMNTER
jgi:hypothetical protein